MKTFDIPIFYRSPIIGKVKSSRKDRDPRKKDFKPSVLDFGPVRFYIARHFGFCFGVENAIEISYKALEENPGKRIFLLSQMIHNPTVNKDLQDRGITFIMDTEGCQLIEWEELTAEDIVIIPAFGTTIEIEKKLEKIGVEPEKYNTTCPFVERVWKKSEKLGKDDFSIVIHGKHRHEETRATFSHSYQNAPSVIVKNMEETVVLGDIISGKIPLDRFYELFEGRYSKDFDPERDLKRIGVVNQTTMLASETQGIANYLKEIMIDKFGEDSYKEHFADTRDTLCYATNDNQQSTMALVKTDADLALVVGGYNSSNTSHLVELCEENFPTYFINTENEIESADSINHFDIHQQKRTNSLNFLPKKEKVNIVLTSGASCPDSMVDQVLQKMLQYFPGHRKIEEVLSEF